MLKIKNLLSGISSYSHDKAQHIIAAVLSLFRAKDNKGTVSHTGPSSSFHASIRGGSEFELAKGVFVCRIMHGEPDWFKQLFVTLSGLLFYLAGVLTGVTIYHFYG